MVVPVKTEPTFSLETPRTLFQGTYFFPNVSNMGEALANLYPWDISPDGKRFLMMKEAKPAAAESPRKISIVVNWFEELKQRLPTK
jgi:hypothetical protein